MPSPDYSKPTLLPACFVPPFSRIVMTSNRPASVNRSLSSALRYFQSIMPALDGTAYKGQSGRICVVGGSPEYTGAPYFAATSALRAGADLTYIATNGESAAAAIKAIAPDLIVYPSIDAVFDLLPRAHALIIGPGLGRSHNVPQKIEKILNHPDSLKIPIVLDADALYFVANSNSIRDAITRRPSNVPPIALTPNIIEYKRLCTMLDIQNDDFDQLVHQMGPGVILLVKGKIDRVLSQDFNVQVNNPASLKRVGGQGDVLAGITAVALAWCHLNLQRLGLEKNQSFPSEGDNAGLALAAASALTRECSNRAYVKHGRSLVTSDIIPFIGSVMYDLEFGLLTEKMTDSSRDCSEL